MYKKYMHLINGVPAFFEGQITYAGKYIKESMMVDTLAEIKAQQMVSREYRKDKGWDDAKDFIYGYIIVYFGK